jgi:hypothetical protein
VPVQYLPADLTKALLLRAGVQKDRTHLIYATDEALPRCISAASPSVENSLNNPHRPSLEHHFHTPSYRVNHRKVAVANIDAAEPNREAAESHREAAEPHSGAAFSNSDTAFAKMSTAVAKMSTADPHRHSEEPNRDAAVPNSRAAHPHSDAAAANREAAHTK